MLWGQLIFTELAGHCFSKVDGIICRIPQLAGVYTLESLPPCKKQHISFKLDTLRVSDV